MSFTVDMIYMIFEEEINMKLLREIQVVGNLIEEYDWYGEKQVYINNNIIDMSYEEAIDYMIIMHREDILW